jgi:hypothetical protein
MNMARERRGGGWRREGVGEKINRFPECENFWPV